MLLLKRILKLRLLIFFILSLQVFPAKVFGGKCTGSSNCSACTTCSSCKHCAHNGGTCSVCGGGDNDRSYGSSSSSSRGSHGSSYLGWIIAGGLILLLLAKGSNSNKK